MNKSSKGLQLALATGAFAVCFAAFGSVSAMMPILKKTLGLTPMQASVAIAIPVLLGSLGRIPLGILTDRYGGRRVFIGVLAASALSAAAMALVGSYTALVFTGFFLGIALASFAVGVGFSSGWFPPERQGTALGIYGAGNVGQSLAAFGAPVIARAWGVPWGFTTFALLAAAWLALWFAFARDPVRAAPPRTLKQMLLPLREPGSWVLSLYYFLSFGGFVSMAIYLPTFLTELFGMTPQQAGLRTAGFVLLATAMRPVGGWLSDKFGGRHILFGVFPAVVAMALLLSLSGLGSFRIGALGMAVAIGLGNGAVFKLVPELFPKSVGAVTGLVGAAGGLGGFFPPLVLGAVRQATGSFVPAFALLGAFALSCLLVLALFGRRPQPAY
ncbi:MAG TPA: MFS transporter [Myxococcales bacterium]|nr:MFS transporter [Myxococcales bacterium]